jgi:hypothetical protein
MKNYFKGVAAIIEVEKVCFPKQFHGKQLEITHMHLVWSCLVEIARSDVHERVGCLFEEVLIARCRRVGRRGCG